VLIVDPVALFRAALTRLLESDERLEIVGEAGDGLEALEKVKALEPDVVLMELEMPNLDGVSATRSILAENPGVKVVIVTGVDADVSVLQALKAGASGYMLKDSHAEAIASAVLAAAAGEQVLSGAVVSRMLHLTERSIKPKEFYNGLTDREIEVLRMLARGMTTKQVAYKLAVSHKTIRNHVSNVYRKLHVADRSQAVLYALRKGLVEV
jgi:DNA-binding NarL/FixJ family response regulator